MVWVRTDDIRFASTIATIGEFSHYEPRYLEQVHNSFFQMVNLNIYFITDKYKEWGQPPLLVTGLNRWSR
jgi:hypothetical protein